MCARCVDGGGGGGGLRSGFIGGSDFGELVFRLFF